MKDFVIWFYNVLKRFYTFGVKLNFYLWFHILAGAFLSNFVSIFDILVIALLWEFIEFLTLLMNKNRLKREYNNWEFFFYDAIGDILGAILGGVL